MSIRRMTLGSGYRYLMSSVARGDAAARTSDPLTGYYTAQGAPPGRFLGKGLAGLGGGHGVRLGSEVTEEHLWRMLGMLQDPLTGEALGRAPIACLGGGDPAKETSGRRCSAKTVGGFDLTFSAPKSVSVAWALADPETRSRIRTAHARALEFVIAYAEREVFATRTGHGGVISQDVRGAIATAFEHWDSRAGDPQLHTHVVVLNRVQAASDGGWRTLDSKAMFRAAVGLSELYNGVLADLLTADLGVGWEPQRRRRSAEPKWEIAGVPEALQREFSQRSDQIEQAKVQLVRDFAATHGRQPTSTEILKLRQQATLETRPDKHLASLQELVEGWRRRAVPHVGAEQESWVAGLAGRNDLPLLRADDLAQEILADTAEVSLANVATKRSTFTRANLFAEALRQVAGVRFAEPGERVVVAERVAGLSVERAVRLSPEDADLGLLPTALRRVDGTSRLRPRNAVLYSSRQVIEAERRLIEAGRSVQGPVVDEQQVVAVVGGALLGGEQVLSPEQAAAVSSIATSGRGLDVLVGPAGTGKSTTMGGIRAVWEAGFGAGSVVGLAPSAAAAEVLSEAVGIPTENTTKWLVELARAPEKQARLEALVNHLCGASPSLRTRALRQQAHRLADDLARSTPRPGQLLIVDEASMAGTVELDQIATAATAVGAKVLLVGDWAQLSPVAAGGAFKLLATDRHDPPELHDVRRFRHEWERAASLKLRTGRPTAVDEYVRRGRVVGGDRGTVLDALFEAWRADRAAGLTTLMMAVDTQTVGELNHRARAYRVALGEVEAASVPLQDGVTVGVGDHVVTRLNQRDLTSGLPGTEGAGWVKNGDQWIVTKARTDGTLQVRRPRGGQVVTLPAAYVRNHVELGYATTAHRAQGRTVDTAHAYVAGTTTREPLYVMATRGRESNKLYVDTAYQPEPLITHGDNESAAPEVVLRAAIERSGADISATTTRDQERATANSPGRLQAVGVAIMDARREHRYTTLLKTAGLSEATLRALKNTGVWRALMLRMQHADSLGTDMAAHAAATMGALQGASGKENEHMNAVRHWAVAAERDAPRSSSFGDGRAPSRVCEIDVL